jgi:parallel beta-helix repeat protein
MKEPINRTRQARQGAISAILAVGLAACGGGSTDSSTASSNGEPRSATQVVVGDNIPTSLLTGAGWAAVQPEVQPASGYQADLTARSKVIYLAARGNNPGDGNNANAGTSSAAPWETLKHAQANMASVDAILLRCGDTFRGSLEIASVAQGAHDVLIGGYGDCSGNRRPVISGSNWIGGGNWTQVAPASRVYTRPYSVAPAKLDRLFLNNLPLIKARFPNTDAPWGGYARLSSNHVASTTTLTLDTAAVNQIGSNPVVGAFIHVRTTPWTIDTGVVKAYSGGVMTIEAWDAEARTVLDKGLPNVITKASGFVLEGKKWMIDVPGEWALETDNVTSTSALYLHLPDAMDPAALAQGLGNLEGSVETYGVHLKWRKGQLVGTAIRGARVERVLFKHQAYASVKLLETDNAEVLDIRSEHAGAFGVNVLTAPKVKVSLSQFDGAGESGVEARDTSELLVANNVFTQTGMYGRAAGSAAAIGVGTGVTGSTKAVIENNVIRDSAKNGMTIKNADGVKIVGNTVVSSCLRYADCAGIYIDGLGPHGEGEPSPGFPAVGALVDANMIVQAKSNWFGYSVPYPIPQAYGIYLDETSAHVTVRNNVISNVEGGIYLHDAFENTVEGNKVRGVTYASFIGAQSRAAKSLYGNLIRNNDFFSLRSAEVETGPGAIYDAPRTQVYAQVWDHPTDPLLLLKSVASGGYGNQSQGNQTLTVANGQVPSWRAIDSITTTNGGGAIWALSTKGEVATTKLFHFEKWRAWYGQTDTQNAAIPFKQYQLIGTPAPSLVNNAINGYTGWDGYFPVPNPGSLTLGVPGCDTFCLRMNFAKAGEFVHSNTFQLNMADNSPLYLLRYTVRAGVNGAIHGSTVRHALSPYASLGHKLPYLPLEPQQKIRIEQFMRTVRPEVSTPQVVNDAILELRTTAGGYDQAAAKKDIYVDDVSFIPVESANVAFRPSMETLALSVVNLSKEEQTLSCGDLGQLPSCAYVDENGQNVSPITVGRRASRYLFKKNTTWIELPN